MAGLSDTAFLWMKRSSCRCRLIILNSMENEDRTSYILLWFPLLNIEQLCHKYITHHKEIYSK